MQIEPPAASSTGSRVIRRQEQIPILRGGDERRQPRPPERGDGQDDAPTEEDGQLEHFGPNDRPESARDRVDAVTPR